ncbi:MAG: hydrogenase maturation nickel metallochaperone HypA [Nitrospirae bacterium]|nr:hydrogenase maturation nickel metallochaperone HypA [Nitrospirota bacterium]
MHEVSIAQGLLDIAIEHCKKGGYQRIESISVKIGKASGVVPDSLLFAFETLKIGTIAEKASLTINEIKVSGYCKNCECRFSVEEAYVLECQKCGSTQLVIETGRELNIDEMEVF